MHLKIPGAVVLHGGKEVPTTFEIDVMSYHSDHTTIEIDLGDVRIRFPNPRRTPSELPGGEVKP